MTLRMSHFFHRLILFGLTVSLVLSLSAWPAKAQQSAPALPDVDRNGLVTYVDALELAHSWNLLQQDNECMAPSWHERDLDQDGCISVADIQTSLAGWGQVNEASLRAAEEAAPQAAETITVTSADDDPSAPCDAPDARCTLPAAINRANSRPGSWIRFNIRNSDGSCPELVTINLERSLSLLANNTTIDGYSQCGARPSGTPDPQRPWRGNAVIKIELRGPRTVPSDAPVDQLIVGLMIYSRGNLIRGLAINSFYRQIMLYGQGAVANRIEGNFIGTDPRQSYTDSRGGENRWQGIVLVDGPSYNTIGGDNPEQRNIISGNGKDGVQIQGQGTFRNRLIGNYIGLKQDGESVLRNGSDGVDINNGPQYTIMERNVVSGNQSDGIEISHSDQTRYNEIRYNYFGTDASGTRLPASRSWGNSVNGVTFEDQVSENLAYGNVIAGNGSNGVRFYVLATKNRVFGNKIGVNVGGDPLSNGRNPNTTRWRNGVYIMGGSQYNIISDNIIANHPENGVLVSNESDDDHNGFGETFYNTISRNSIYNNGLQGIRLTEKRGVYANQNIRPPTIAKATTAVVIGQASAPGGAACANCRVEIFLTDESSDTAGEGKTFVGEAVTGANGNFVVGVSGVAIGKQVTATTTDTLGNTSPFSMNVTVVAADPTDPPPQPSPTPSPSPSPIPSPPPPPPESWHVWLPLITR